MSPLTDPGLQIASPDSDFAVHDLDLLSPKRGEGLFNREQHRASQGSGGSKAGRWETARWVHMAAEEMMMVHNSLFDEL
jgi:hypothetical protein